MKKFINKLIIRGFVIITLLAPTASCNFEEQIDPNGPSLSGVILNASVAQLNNLAVAVEASLRLNFEVGNTASGTMARELYLFDADPRNTIDLLGKNGTVLDNNTFYTTAPFFGKYICVKNANILIESANNSNSANAEQKAGYNGFAKTIKALQLIEIIRLYDQARVDVSNPDNLGPFLAKAQALAEITSILNDAVTDLNNAGDDFPFALSIGFDGFDTPETFKLFNRAVAARASLYAENWNQVLTDLGNSFFDIDGSFTTGPKMIFSTAGGDLTNGMFKTPGQNGDQIIVHNSFIDDAEDGDTRITAKTAVRVNATSQDGLNGTHETRLYASNISPVSIIRNEELILIYAEAKIRLGGAGNFGDAENALNVIRNAYDLPDYGGALDEPSLRSEMLKQRRYSLWGEGHRMFDLRRYNLSNTLPIDRAGDVVYNVLPIPITENN
jgi:starch-binding outer membrane protein, SusD/RagB family